MEPLEGFRGNHEKTGMRPTLANGCSKIKRPSRLGLLVAMDSGEKRWDGLRDNDELTDIDFAGSDEC
jgi:hypothetical protein